MSDVRQAYSRVVRYTAQLFLLGAVWLIAIHLLATYWYEAGLGRRGDLDNVRNRIFDYKSALTAFVVAHFCLMPPQSGLWGKLRWLVAASLTGPAIHYSYAWGEYGGTVFSDTVRIFLSQIHVLLMWVPVAILHALRGPPPNVGLKRFLLGYLGFALWALVLQHGARLTLRSKPDGRPPWVDFGEPLDGLLWLAAVVTSYSLLFGWAGRHLYRPRTITGIVAVVLFCAAISSITFFYEEGRKPRSFILLQR